MKDKSELEDIIQRIASENSPVGMDAVYVHALILDKLVQIEQRLEHLEQSNNSATSCKSNSNTNSET